MIIIKLLRHSAFSLSEGVDDDKVLGLLELDCGVPSLPTRWNLFDSLLDESRVEPEVEGALVEIELQANNSGRCGAELLHDLLLATLAWYSDLCEREKLSGVKGRVLCQNDERNNQAYENGALKVGEYLRKC